MRHYSRVPLVVKNSTGYTEWAIHKSCKLWGKKAKNKTLVTHFSFKQYGKKNNFCCCCCEGNQMLTVYQYRCNDSLTIHLCFKFQATLSTFFFWLSIWDSRRTPSPHHLVLARLPKFPTQRSFLFTEGTVFHNLFKTQPLFNIFKRIKMLKINNCTMQFSRIVFFIGSFLNALGRLNLLFIDIAVAPKGQSPVEVKWHPAMLTFLRQLREHGAKRNKVFFFNQARSKLVGCYLLCSNRVCQRGVFSPALVYVPTPLFLSSLINPYWWAKCFRPICLADLWGPLCYWLDTGCTLSTHIQTDAGPRRALTCQFLILC